MVAPAARSVRSRGLASTSVSSESPLFVRAGVLCGPYLVQGLVYGFAAFVLIPTLAQRGVALEAQAGVLALAGAPWVLKVAWGPLVDAVPWARGAPGRIAAVATLGVAGCAAWLASGVERGADVVVLASAWLGLNVALALQDVATDALAFDAVRPEERGAAQASMLLGHHLGHEGIAGLWLPGYAAVHGLGAPLWILAGVATALAALPLWVIAGGRRPARDPLLASLAAVARDARSRRALLLAMFVLAADVVTSTVAGAFWIDRLGWDAADVGPFVSPLLLAGGVLGYGLAIPVVDRVGHRRAAAIGSATLGACWIAFAIAEPLWARPAFMGTFVIVQSVASAMMLAGVHALLMDALDARVRATQYAISTACLNLPRVWAALVAPPLFASLGFAALFAVCGAYQIAVVGLVLAVRERP